MPHAKDEKNTNITLSMIERLGGFDKSSGHASSQSSSLNSNYDFEFEFEAKEAKGRHILINLSDLWKKHLGDDQETYDSRFKQKSPFNNTFSPIENNMRNQFKEVELEFDDSQLKNFETLKAKMEKSSLTPKTYEKVNISQKM